MERDSLGGTPVPKRLSEQRKRWCQSVCPLRSGLRTRRRGEKFTTTRDQHRARSMPLTVERAFTHRRSAPRASERRGAACSRRRSSGSVDRSARRDPRARAARLDSRGRWRWPGEHAQEGPRRPQRSEDDGRTLDAKMTGEQLFLHSFNGFWLTALT